MPTHPAEVALWHRLSTCAAALQYTLDMRLLRLSVLLCALLVTSLSAAITPAEYQARRAELVARDLQVVHRVEEAAPGELRRAAGADLVAAQQQALQAAQVRRALKRFASPPGSRQWA